jgi:hypothetical protein
VNLDETKIADDLAHSVHATAAAEVLETLNTLDYGLDAIAFVARVQPQGLAALLIVTDDNGSLSLSEAQELFGHRP